MFSIQFILSRQDILHYNSSIFVRDCKICNSRISFRDKIYRHVWYRYIVLDVNDSGLYSERFIDTRIRYCLRIDHYAED